MFETKYSRMLTWILIAGIALIILIFTVVAVLIARNSRLEDEAEEAAKGFENVVKSGYIDSGSSESGEVGDVDLDLNTDLNLNLNLDLSSLIATDATNTTTGSTSTNGLPLYKNKYPIAGIIEIPSINLKYQILIGGYQALEESIIMYDPSQTELNIVGNVTLAGHDYRDGRFFANNYKLAEGDKIYITDATGQKVTYVIYNTYTTSPEDSTHLERDTEGRREITLTTCADLSQSRLIILAREQ